MPVEPSPRNGERGDAGRRTRFWPRPALYDLTPELLGDPEVVASARLRRPIVLQVAAALGLAPSGITEVDSLVASLSPHLVRKL